MSQPPAQKPPVSGQGKPIQTSQPTPPAKPVGEKSAAESDMRLKCSHCATPMRVPLKVLEGKQQVNVRCPNAKCGKTVTLKKKQDVATTAGKQTPANIINKEERNMNYDNE
jgi:hypothetical protein